MMHVTQVYRIDNNATSPGDQIHYGMSHCEQFIDIAGCIVV